MVLLYLLSESADYYNNIIIAIYMYTCTLIRKDSKLASAPDVEDYGICITNHDIYTIVYTLVTVVSILHNNYVSFSHVCVWFVLLERLHVF